MKQCWRWFGPEDPITLDQLHMVGVEGIVTALHDLPPGMVWPRERIAERRAKLASAGFSWDVVESLPVSEAIKTQGPDCGDHLAAYLISLENLAAEGVGTVCYNFMPILDWTRTCLREPQSHGGTAMAFDLVDFAAFDIFILERPGAAEDFGSEIADMARQRFSEITDDRRRDLARTVVAGLPGANEGWTLDAVRERLATYRGMGRERLRGHLVDFLAEVAPVAERLGIRLCCHPDDPPFSLLGLPRVMSSTADYARVLSAVDIPANGATLCTGSLGVAPDFDAPAFVRELGPRIHFVHLRNVKRRPSPDPLRPSFLEAAHLEGGTDMAAVVKALTDEERQRHEIGRADRQIPMRPDHGQELLTDRNAPSLPGYPLIGRMRGLAELRGLMAAFGSGA